jgi:hypothetical protein
MKLKTVKRKYMWETALTLALARFAVRFVPAERIFSWADRLPRHVNRFAVGEVSWITWAVERKSNSPGAKISCLPRALAVHAMLRRRGIVSRLCLGVARDRQKLIAHAWVETGERAITQDPDLVRFTRLAQFGGFPT